jgi:hypothetical protein
MTNAVEKGYIDYGYLTQKAEWVLFGHVKIAIFATLLAISNAQIIKSIDHEKNSEVGFDRFILDIAAIGFRMGNDRASGYRQNC